MNTDAITKIAATLNCYNYDADEKLNSDSTWTVISCPLAPWTHQGSGRDMNPSFSVNVEPGNSMCKCYSCDFTGPISAAVRKVFESGGIDAEVYEELQKFIEAEEKRKYDVEEFVYVPELPSFFTDYFYQMHEYMRERGLDETDMQRWGLGYSADLERILIPFYDSDGTLVAVIGRDVSGEAALKYMIYPKSFPRNRYLFGENKLTGAEKRILLVEGYLDAVVARKYLDEDTGVLAIGTAIPSERQLREVLALTPEVVLGLDNPEFDKAGEKGYSKAKKYLLGRCNVSYLDYRQFKDAGEAGDKIALIVENRIPYRITSEVSMKLNEMLGRMTA